MNHSGSGSTEPAMDDPTGRHGTNALTRRSALLALSATIVSPIAMAQQIKPVIRIQRFNNVRIAVSDLERSAAFYERLFGPPLRQRDAVVFRIGDGPYFLALTAVTGGAKPDYLSYGLSALDFDAERVMRSLADLGVSGGQIVRRGDTPELFLPDANGIKIQLQDPAYGYGSGPKGNISPPGPTAVATSQFLLKSIHQPRHTHRRERGSRDGILPDRVRSSHAPHAGKRRWFWNRRLGGIAIMSCGTASARRTPASNPSLIMSISRPSVTISTFISLWRRRYSNTNGLSSWRPPASEQLNRSVPVGLRL
jgi:catechol 2,3-dioxygenase-like lactoylglutathione lyase family enzyme